MRTLRILGLSLLVGSVGCADLSSPKPVGNRVQTIADSADQIAFKSRTLITDRGLLRAEILADTSLFLDQNTRVAMRIVQGVFYDGAGAQTATMTARTGSFDTRNSIMEAWGDVRIISVDGRTLRTPMIKFDNRLNQVMSDSPFVMTEPPDREVRGVGFRADPDLNTIQTLKVQKGKAGTFRLPGG